MSKPTPARYRTTNWSEYNAALRKRGSLLVWLDREMEWFAPKRGRPGRPETFSDAAIQFCLSIKVLFGLALRQTIGMVASLLKLAGLEHWPVPDYTTLCRRHRVEKSGTGQSKPANLRRLATIPIVCRKAKPKSTLIDRQNWMAASEKVCGRPGWPRFGANHSISRSSQTSREPRRRSDALYSGQFVVR